MLIRDLVAALVLKNSGASHLRALPGGVWARDFLPPRVLQHDSSRKRQQKNAGGEGVPVRLTSRPRPGPWRTQPDGRGIVATLPVAGAHPRSVFGHPVTRRAGPRAGRPRPSRAGQWHRAARIARQIGQQSRRAAQPGTEVFRHTAAIGFDDCSATPGEQDGYFEPADG